jgi:membrane-associated phospholipid phosphatase
MRKYLAFYIPFLLYVVVMLVVLNSYSKSELHLMLTSVHTPFLDIFFKYYTEVGGSVPYIVAAGLLFYKYRMTLFILSTQLVTAVFSFVAKNYWQRPRPLLYFSQHFPSFKLHQVEGVELFMHNSLPSGHTITAFSFFLALTYFTKNKYLHFLYFVLAVLVAYSRVYLSQHFALDVLIGALIGFFVTFFGRMYVDYRPIAWGEGSLRDVFFRKKI